MSLNKFMHPRNQYKKSKPSFLELALKYPDFRAHTTQDDSGKVFLDFKNSDALRALTTCLLKEDFGLNVLLPSDRLVPTLPLRLNYIHWLEDIIGTDEGKWGIDIGTGASCIYPLLAAKMNKWKFLATEADAENFFHAKKNVNTNGLEDLIHVKQVSTEDALSGPLESFQETNKFDFCMCNPPFFADHMEAQAISSTRSVDRPEAGSISTASPQECIALGGEVGFIRQMIEESAVLKDKIRIYSSMVGKKSSLGQLKEELRHHKISKFSTTEFCQGKTMRWGIAWTFDDSVTFPRSQFESRKEKPPLHYVVPKGACGLKYEVHQIASYLKNILESIKIHCYQGKTAKSYSSITLTAVENTWCHQRRLRRQKQRNEKQQQQPKNDQTMDSGQESSPEKKIHASLDCKNGEKFQEGSNGNKSERIESGNNSLKFSDNDGNRKRPPDELDDDTGSCVKKQKQENKDGEESSKTNESKSSTCDGSLSHSKLESESKTQVESSSGNFQSDNSATGNESVTANMSEGAQEENSSDPTASNTSPKDYILQCVMRLKRADEQIHLELEFLDGHTRETMHQLFTFIKNKLSQTQK